MMEVRHTVGKQLHDTKVGWRDLEKQGGREEKEMPEPSGLLSGDYQRWLSGKEKRIVALEKYLFPQSL